MTLAKDAALKRRERDKMKHLFCVMLAVCLALTSAGCASDDIDANTIVFFLEGKVISKMQSGLK